MLREKNSEANKIPSGGIPLAIDANIFRYLESLANPSFDPTGEVIRALKNNSLYPVNYENVKPENLPPILQDGYLGVSGEMDDIYGNSHKMYFNLYAIYYLYRLIIENKVRIYLPPTAYFEVKNRYDNSVMKDYCTVVEIPDEKAEDYFSRVKSLADEYANRNAMESDYSAYYRRYVPKSDAVIMAESSILGLILITADSKDFINYIRGQDDYERANLISKINGEMGYYFKDNNGAYTPSIPLTPITLRARMKHLFNKSAVVRTIWLDGDKEYLDPNNV